MKTQNTTHIIEALTAKGFTPEVTKVVKNGVTLTGIINKPENATCCPTVYIDGLDDDEAIRACEKGFTMAVPKELEIDFGEIFDNPDTTKFKARLFGKGKSGSNLVKPFLDLEICVVYDLGGASFKISKQNAEKMGINEQELFLTALENSYADCKTDNIGLMLKKMGFDLGMDVDEAMQFLPPMTVITTNSLYGGAIHLTNTKKLKELADKLNDDLYILPSSLHELIAVPVSLGEVEQLRQMVSEVNQTEVSETELLSYSVYRFNRDTETVTLA